MLALRSQIFQYVREFFLQTYLGAMNTGSFRKGNEKQVVSSSTETTDRRWSF